MRLSKEVSQSLPKSYSRVRECSDASSLQHSTLSCTEQQRQGWPDMQYTALGHTVAVSTPTNRFGMWL